jgi:hypothetical protein
LPIPFALFSGTETFHTYVIEKYANERPNQFESRLLSLPRAVTSNSIGTNHRLSVLAACQLRNLVP